MQYPVEPAHAYLELSFIYQLLKRSIGFFFYQLLKPLQIFSHNFTPRSRAGQGFITPRILISGTYLVNPACADAELLGYSVHRCSAFYFRYYSFS